MAAQASQLLTGMRPPLWSCENRTGGASESQTYGYDGAGNRTTVNGGNPNKHS